MEYDLARANLKMEDYLKHINKTREEIKTEWTPAAEKRAKLQLILNKIAKEEKITPDEKLVENQVKDILDMYKNANKHNVHTYVSTSLLGNNCSHVGHFHGMPKNILTIASTEM